MGKPQELFIQDYLTHEPSTPRIGIFSPFGKQKVIKNALI
jgi:hypothetical protein